MAMLIPHADLLNPGEAAETAPWPATLSLPLSEPLENIQQLMQEFELPLKRVLRARTKIVATVGPACFEPTQLAALARSGVSVFRLNMAHGSPEDYQPHVDHIRQVSEELNEPLAILVDLAGPKFRLGELPDTGLYCGRDDNFFFVRKNPAAANELITTYEALVDELAVGDLVMIADGTVSMVVEEKLPDRVRVRVLQGGMIRSRQGINLAGGQTECAGD